MTEPTLALTFQDLQIRIAEYLGVAYYGAGGDEAAQVPTNTHDLELVKRICNDGWRRFVNSNPRWAWLTPTFTVTFDPTGAGPQCVNSEAWRYYLPDGFYGHFVSWFTYGTSGPRLRIDQTTEAEIRMLRAASGDSSGDPYLCAIRPLEVAVTNSFSNKWEAIFFPTPDGTETITARCRIYPNRLVNDDDRHNAGFQFDEAVLAACLAEAERQRSDASGVQEAQWAESLVRAIAIDQGSAPRRLGYNGDGSDGILPRGSRHPYTGVDTYNGVSV